MAERKTVRKRAGATRKRKTRPALKKVPAKRKAAAAVSARRAPRSSGVNENSERVVVDEIMENGRARILRAARLPKTSSKDLGIDTWDDEVEDAISVWKLEAYVGFKAPRKLKEGDVFFIKDGSDLNETYMGPKIMARDKAAGKHLIEAADESREQARNEIKQRFFNLTAQRAGRNDKDRDKLFEIVKKRVWKGKR